MNKSFSKNTRVIYILEALVFSYIITGLLLLLTSFLMLKLELPSLVFSAAINVAYIVSAFTGGFFIGKRTEQKKFIWGLFVGVLYFIILMVVSLMMDRVGTLSLGSLFTVFIITGLSGMLGGMIS
jgi:putative membrane protein (TIGR04086 family)